VTENPSEKPKVLPPGAIPQPHGGYLIPGAGGGPQPGSGRPSHEYREKLRAILDKPEVQEALEAILADPKHPQFAALFGKVVAQAHGNPTQPVALEGGSLPALRVELSE
jgi:hypothetical protein